MPSTGTPRSARGVGGRRVGVVDRRRAAGEDDAERLVGLNFVERRRAGQHDGEDVLLADAARDELRILRAEIEDDERPEVLARVL
jgi:hypothetical protein